MWYNTDMIERDTLEQGDDMAEIDKMIKADDIKTWLVHEADEDIDCGILETLSECFAELTVKQIDSICKVMEFLKVRGLIT